MILNGLEVAPQNSLGLVSEIVQPELVNSLYRSAESLPRAFAKPLLLTGPEQRDQIVVLVEGSIGMLEGAKHALNGDSRRIHRKREAFVSPELSRIAHAIERR